MKIGIYTDALGQHISGGILCIVEVLNKLVEWGHDCTCFVNHEPLRSDWLQTNFRILPAIDVKKFDGILISPYSPTAKAVAEAENAEDRFYWIHTNESLFCHNDKEWQDQARKSYSLPLKIFCTSTYLQILMETVFNRHVISHLVPPGVDLKVFYSHGREAYMGDRSGYNLPYSLGILCRGGWVRGEDITRKAISIIQAKTPYGYIRPIAFGNISDRHEMANVMRELAFYIDLSRVAGSPTPVREAMACGCIPISTKYGTTDFILNGYNGYIVPPDDPQIVANLIMDIIKRQEDGLYVMNDLSNAAADYAKENFGWDNIAKNFILALEEGKGRGDELLKFRDWSLRR